MLKTTYITSIFSKKKKKTNYNPSHKTRIKWLEKSI